MEPIEHPRSSLTGMPLVNLKALHTLQVENKLHWSYEFSDAREAREAQAVHEGSILVTDHWDGSYTLGISIVDAVGYIVLSPERIEGKDESIFWWSEQLPTCGTCKDGEGHSLTFSPRVTHCPRCSNPVVPPSLPIPAHGPPRRWHLEQWKGCSGPDCATFRGPMDMVTCPRCGEPLETRDPLPFNGDDEA